MNSLPLLVHADQKKMDQAKPGDQQMRVLSRQKMHFLHFSETVQNLSAPPQLLLHLQSWWRLWFDVARWEKFEITYFSFEKTLRCLNRSRIIGRLWTSFGGITRLLEQKIMHCKLVKYLLPQFDFLEFDLRPIWNTGFAKINHMHESPHCMQQFWRKLSSKLWFWTLSLIWNVGCRGEEEIQWKVESQ